MQLDIKTRHFTLGDEQREKIESTLEKLERFSPRPLLETRLSITQERGQFLADAVLYMKNNEFRAKGESTEPELAASEVTENLRAQLTKFKGKISSRQKRELGGLGKAMQADMPVADTAVPLAEVEGFDLTDLGAEEAMQTFQSSDLPFLVFRNLATGCLSVVYRRKDGELGLMEANPE